MLSGDAYAPRTNRGLDSRLVLALEHEAKLAEDAEAAPEVMYTEAAAVTHLVDADGKPEHEEVTVCRGCGVVRRVYDPATKRAEACAVCGFDGRQDTIGGQLRPDWAPRRRHL